MAGQNALGRGAEEEAADGRGEVEEDKEGEEKRPHEEGVHQDVDPVAVVRAVESVVLLEIEHALDPHRGNSCPSSVLVFGETYACGCVKVGVEKEVESVSCAWC